MTGDWKLQGFEEAAAALEVSTGVGQRITEWAHSLRTDPVPDYAVSYWFLDDEERGSYFFSKVPGTEHDFAMSGNQAVACGWRVHAGRRTVECDLLDVYPDIGLNMEPDYPPPPDD